MAKHWTHFLPESGTIAKEGDKQLARLKELEAARQKWEDLRREYLQEENRLQALAEREWTGNEINQAFARYIKEGEHMTE